MKKYFLINILPLLLIIAIPASAQLINRPLSAQQLEQATRQAVTANEWLQLKQLADQALVNVTVGASKGSAANFERIISDSVMPVALAQSAFIRVVTPETLTTLNSNDDMRSFLSWLMFKRAVIEDCLECIKTQDKIPEVMRIWSQLWKSDPTGRDKLYNLALACAVVFDEPLKMNRVYGQNERIDAQARYDYFRKSAEANTLKTSLVELPAWESIWIVDAPVPNSELEWANSHVKYPRDNWNKAYEEIEYRMDKLEKGNTVYEEYTLEQIQKEGGICTDQAYYAAVSAKANGIPAIMFTGEGQRGGHAWFGYKASTKEWNMNAGRYKDDLYATGYAFNPQTRERVKEQSLIILSDPQIRSPDYRKSSQLTWLSAVLLEAKQIAPAVKALKKAIELSSRHTGAWTAYTALLKQAGAPAAEWKTAITAMRSAFKNYPDMLAVADKLETESVLASKGAQGAADVLNKQARKTELKHGDRSDLVAENITQQVTILMQAKDIKGAEKVYQVALKTHGADKVLFQQLSNEYVEFAKTANVLHKAVDYIESIFKRYHPRPAGDYFTMKTYAEMLDMLAEFCKADKQNSTAERYRKDAERIRKQMESLAR